MFDYPLRMKCRFDNTVVEFTALQHGTVVATDDDSFDEIGEACNFWMPHTDSTVWERCPEGLLDAEDDAHGDTSG